MCLVNTWMGDPPTGIAPKVWYVTMPSCAVLHIYTSVTQFGKKRLGCVLSCLCDWCTLKNMQGPLEYAQPPFIYLPDMSVWVCEMSNVCLWRQIEGSTAPHEVEDLYDPQGFDLGWCGSSSNIKVWQRKWWGLSQNELVTVKCAIDIC